MEKADKGGEGVTNRYNLQVFIPGRSRVRLVPTVTLQQTGDLSLSWGAYTALGKPERLRLMFDKARKVLAIVAATEGTTNAVLVRTYGEGKSVICTFRQGMSQMGISFREAMRFRLARHTQDGVDMFVADLTQQGQPVSKHGPRQVLEEPQYTDDSAVSQGKDGRPVFGGGRLSSFRSA